MSQLAACLPNDSDIARSQQLVVVTETSTQLRVASSQQVLFNRLGLECVCLGTGTDVIAKLQYPSVTANHLVQGIGIEPYPNPGTYLSLPLCALKQSISHGIHIVCND